jgi:hypothetical protein
MRYHWLSLFTAMACTGAHGDAGDRADARGTPDRELAAPRVVLEPAVVVFWLAASDTLLPGEAAAAYDELTLAAEAVAGALAAFDIELYPTHADTLYVALPGRQRRAVPLSGRAYPFGYVLVEPGGVERVLVGVYGQAELLDEIRVYFDLPEDTGFTPDRIAAD